MPKVTFSTFTFKSLSLPAPDPRGQVRRVDYWDQSYPAFGLRLSSTGAATWMLMRRVERGGRRTLVRVKLGRCRIRDGGRLEGMSLSEARAEADRWSSMMEAGVDPREHRQQEKQERLAESEKTFSAISAKFLAHMENEVEKGNNRPKTVAEYRRVLEGADFKKWAHRPLGGLAKRNIQTEVARIADRAPVQANRSLAALRAMCNWAVSRGHLDTSPTDRVRAPAKESPRDRHLFGSEYEKRPSEIALAWKAFGCIPRYAPIFQLLLLTGQRLGEVAGMGWSELVDLDGDRPRWLLPGDRAKNGDDHAVPLGPMAIEVITGVAKVEGRDLVFTVGGEVPIGNFSKAKRELDARISELISADPDKFRGQFSEPWRFHDLRRTFCTGLAEIGIADSVIDSLANHRSGDAHRGVRRVYNLAKHDAAKREAMLIWEDHIATLLAPQARPGETRTA